jgi:hypothetical protein
MKFEDGEEEGFLIGKPEKENWKPLNSTSETIWMRLVCSNSRALSEEDELRALSFLFGWFWLR